MKQIPWILDKDRDIVERIARIDRHRMHLDEIVQKFDPEQAYEVNGQFIHDIQHVINTYHDMLMQCYDEAMHMKLVMGAEQNRLMGIIDKLMIDDDDEAPRMN